MTKFTRNEFWGATGAVAGVLAIGVSLYVWKNPISPPDLIKSDTRPSDAGQPQPQPQPQPHSNPDPESAKPPALPRKVTTNEGNTVVTPPKTGSLSPPMSAVAAAEPELTYHQSAYNILENISPDEAVAATPIAYRSPGKGGWADIYCTVGADGRLHDCRVTASTPDEGLENVGYAVVKNFKVGPLLKNGKPSAGTRYWSHNLIGDEAIKWVETHNPDGSKK